MTATFVIVGAGLAGAKAAEALREEGFEGRVILIGDESERPYERPPLSKGFLIGKSDKEDIYVHPEPWYSRNGVELRRHTRATGVDRSRHLVMLETGESLRYDRLLLATGASPRQLTVPGADLPQVQTLRRVSDSERIKEAIGTVSRIVVIGAGWIGLEVASAARGAGVEVTIVETAQLPLLRVLGREVAEVFAGLHREHGVDLRFAAQVARIVGDDSSPGAGVRLADGSQIDADLVVVGVGAAPNTSLAESAGLAVGDGITVDAQLRSSDPDIFAAGDVAGAFHPLLGKHIRVEHWANALNQPAVAARSMMGVAATYDRIPYFYSDQYDLGMEYCGYVEPHGYDNVVFRGDKHAREFIAFWLKDNKVLAGCNVNVWDVIDHIQALVRSGRAVDPVRLADTATPLSEVLPAVG